MKKQTQSPQLPQTAVSKSVSKIKTYVLTVSEFFPKTHNKSGLPTGFIDKIGSKIKKHTIRGNYPLWKKRIDEIQKGNAEILGCYSASIHFFSRICLRKGNDFELHRCD